MGSFISNVEQFVLDWVHNFIQMFYISLKQTLRPCGGMYDKEFQNFSQTIYQSYVSNKLNHQNHVAVGFYIVIACKVSFLMLYNNLYGVSTFVFLMYWLSSKLLIKPN